MNQHRNPLTDAMNQLNNEINEFIEFNNYWQNHCDSDQLLFNNDPFLPLLSWDPGYELRSFWQILPGRKGTFSFCHPWSITYLKYYFWMKNSKMFSLPIIFFGGGEEKSSDFIFMYTWIFDNELSYSGGLNSLKYGNDHQAFLMFCVRVLSPHL